MNEPGSPRILLIDIETFPLLMYAWRAWETDALRIIEDTSVCSFSAKWLGGKHITKALCDYKGYKPGSRDDSKLLADLWKLLDDADMVSAHNLDRFDAKKINYRFLVHGLPPPSPYQHLDTLKEIKKVASYDSHKLNELCRVQNIGRKLRTGGADLWFDCLGGDRKAWARMKRYNAHDVRLLEPVYLLIRPWMKGHPNLGLYNDITGCPKCGSTRIQARGWAMTAACRYRRYHCQACGGWCRDARKPYSSSDLRNA